LFKRNKSKYNTDNLFVAYSAFEPVARQEIHGHISSQQTKELKEKIDNEAVWTIVSSFSSFVIFFYTEKQAGENMASQLRKELTQLCFELV
jgi:hypothetical protein